MAEVNISPKTNMSAHSAQRLKEALHKNPMAMTAQPLKEALHKNPVAMTRDSNISARTPQKVIFQHEPPQKAFFLAQLNKKLAKSACNSLICLIFM